MSGPARFDDAAAMSEAVRIVLLCLAAAIGYGVLHDQVTARVAPEYFTIMHPALGRPDLFHSSSPTVLGLVWGVVATWWVGLCFGAGLATASRAGARPPIAAGALVTPVLWVLGTMAIVAALAAGAAWAWTTGAHPELASLGLPNERHAPIAAVWAAHAASYLAAFAGAIVLCVRSLRLRRASIASAG